MLSVASLASEERACHIRDYGTFYHNFVTRATYTSVDPAESNHAATFQPIG